MKALIGSITFGIVLLLTAGCEGGWQFGGSADQVHNAGDVDFSGVYTANGGGYLVSNYGNLMPTSAVTVVSEVLFTTVAGQMFYSGQIDVNGLDSRNISGFIGNSGSFTVSPQGVVAGGATGNINVNTGAFGITIGAPSSGVDYSITFSRSGNTISPGGSGVTINSFQITESGTDLQILDNNGSVYAGSLGSQTEVGSTTGINSTSTNAPTVTCQFEAHGVSAAGMTVEMTGNFIAQNVESVSIVGGVYTNIVVIQQTWSRNINGTWVEQGGKSGNINGITTPIVTTQPSGAAGG